MINLDHFRESIGAVEFGLESTDGTKPDLIITIRLMDVILGSIAALVVWMLI